MQPYYELSEGAHGLTVGARALGEGPILAIDPQEVAAEVARKAALLAADPAYYCHLPPETLEAQWEALALLLPDLAQHHPHAFTLEIAGAAWHWGNRLAGLATSFRFGDPATLPQSPLDWLGRQVQEDLLLLLPQGNEYRLAGGQLCCANRWSLDEKLGLSFAEMHAPVPGFAAAVGRPADLLLAHLKAGRPVWRRNWALTLGGDLDLSTRAYPAARARVLAEAGEITAANCGEHCFVRVERQVLARLPASGGILFTIHTYRTPLAALAADAAWRRRFAEVLEQAPADLLAYKGVAPVKEAVATYLAQLFAP